MGMSCVVPAQNMESAIASADDGPGPGKHFWLVHIARAFCRHSRCARRKENFMSSVPEQVMNMDYYCDFYSCWPSDPRIYGFVYF